MHHIVTGLVPSCRRHTLLVKFQLTTAVATDAGDVVLAAVCDVRYGILWHSVLEDRK